MSENKDSSIWGTIVTVITPLVIAAVGSAFTFGKEIANDENNALKIDNISKDKEITELKATIKNKEEDILKLSTDLNGQKNIAQHSVSKSQYDNVANQVKNSVPIQDYNKLKEECQKHQDSLKNVVSVKEYDNLLSKYQQIEVIVREKQVCKQELDAYRKDYKNVMSDLSKPNCGMNIFPCITEHQKNLKGKELEFLKESINNLQNKCF